MKLSDKFYNTLSSMGFENIKFPIFYSAKIGIRFDIGDSADLDTYLKNHKANPKYIEYCCNKSTNIIDSLPNTPDILAIHLYYTSEQELKKDIKSILAVTNLPQPHEICKTVLTQDNEQINSAILLWDLLSTDFSREALLKEIIISDIGGENLLTACVFWLWSDLKVLFHLYDDRGADLIASDKSAIIDIYNNFKEWILEYDKEKITSNFEN